MTEPTPTPEQLAEQAGASEAFSAFEAMDKAANHGERLVIFQDAICHLAESTHHKQSIAGFSVGLIARLDRCTESN